MFSVRAQSRLICWAAIALVLTAAEGVAQKRHPIEVQSVRVVADATGPVIEILLSAPLNPQIQTVESPLRLVVDLPQAILATPRRKIPFRNDQIRSVRVNQFQTDPAIARVVVDLSSPVKYTWDAMGNRLRIRLRVDEVAAAKPPSVPALVAGPQPIAVPVAIGTSGSLIETGNRVSSGSTISAGDQTAILRLTRGGEVRVCPGTTVSVSTSPNGQDLMLGMSQGAMETHYGLKEQVDSVLTPDFRIVLPGPGEFNLALSADSHGNTCVGSMPGSTASAVIAELLGSGTYEIKPEQQVVFRKGRLDTVEPALAPCGCPPMQEPIMRAEADPNSVVSEAKPGQKLQLESSDASSGRQPGDSPMTADDPAAAQPQKPGQLKVQLEAPLVFSGREMEKARMHVPAAPVQQVAALPLMARSPDPMPAIVVLPPADPRQRGFFGKIGHLFGKMF